MKIAHFLTPILALMFIAAAKKQPTVTIRFHTEANEQDTKTFATPVKFQTPPRDGFIQKVPAISERDIAAIYPFPAKDDTMGCAFKLDVHGQIALDALSIERRGTSLVVFVNSRQVVDIFIDRRVSDGIITIPSGLTSQEIAILQKKFPQIGKPQKKS